MAIQLSDLDLNFTGEKDLDLNFSANDFSYANGKDIARGEFKKILVQKCGEKHKDSHSSKKEWLDCALKTCQEIIDNEKKYKPFLVKRAKYFIARHTKNNSSFSEDELEADCSGGEPDLNACGKIIQDSELSNACGLDSSINIGDTYSNFRAFGVGQPSAKKIREARDLANKTGLAVEIGGFGQLIQPPKEGAKYVYYPNMTAMTPITATHVDNPASNAPIQTASTNTSDGRTIQQVKDASTSDIKKDDPNVSAMREELSSMKGNELMQIFINAVAETQSDDVLRSTGEYDALKSMQKQLMLTKGDTDTIRQSVPLIKEEFLKRGTSWDIQLTKIPDYFASQKKVGDTIYNAAKAKEKYQADLENIKTLKTKSTIQTTLLVVGVVAGVSLLGIWAYRKHAGAGMPKMKMIPA